MTDTLTLEESRRYNEACQKQVYADPDMTQKLNALPEAGFKVHPRAITEIIRRVRPDYARYLVCENGKADLYALTNVANSERRTLETLDRNLKRFDGHKPFAEYRPEKREEDKWIEARNEARRKGKRR